MKRLSRREYADMQFMERLANQIEAAEMNREQWWHRVPLKERERAMGVAGMQRERALLPVGVFSDEERARVRSALQWHIAQMELIMRCMEASNTTADGFLRDVKSSLH